jgi:hypothetical protein
LTGIGDLLTGGQHLGDAQGEVSKEGVQRCPALVARPDGVAPRLLQVLQEREHLLEGEVLQRQARDRTAMLLGHEAQEQAYRVAIAADRAQAQPFLHR